MKRAAILFAVSAVTALLFAGCSGDPPDFDKFAKKGKGKASKEVVQKRKGVKDVLKLPQKDVEVEFENFKFEDYFSVDMPKWGEKVNVRNWLEMGSEYTASRRDPVTGASFTIVLKERREEFKDKIKDEAEGWIKDSFGVNQKMNTKRAQIHHYSGVSIEFMSDKDGRKYAGYVAFFADYYDEYRIFGLVEAKKYPEVAKIFKKAAKTFKMNKHYTPVPKSRRGR
ncbi:MAG: hypothetical protein E3J72_13220 [Planctomycetota bacterium]|nr:MAG: hypothetical protein E3J72_13220 [Planctomycetota bacterium]